MSNISDGVNKIQNIISKIKIKIGSKQEEGPIVNERSSLCVFKKEGREVNYTTSACTYESSQSYLLEEING